MSHTIGTDIIIALQQGDHKAFETIFVAYYDRMRLFIDGYIKSEDEAEDITEELFVNLWSNRQSLDTNKSFNSYLHTIARNAAINFLKNRLVRDAYTAHYPQVETAYSSEEELIAREVELLIDMAVEKMPSQRREIYLLSRKEGLKNEEIALRLHTTKRNIESQLSQALKELRKVVTTFLMLVL